MYEKDYSSEGKKMIEVGRVCVKIAGRDAGKKCAVIKVLDDNNVIIDGETRRRKCNIMHLEMMNDKVDIKEEAATEVVCKALGIEFKATKSKEAKARPRKQRKARVKEAPKKVKKDAGKASTPTATK